jgi:hypothetical protein
MSDNSINEDGGEASAYTVREFAHYFKGKDPNWVRRLIAQGKIKAIRGYGEILIPSTELDVIIDSAISKGSRCNGL